ncbi:MAG: putative pterin-4-alpha-carbinolamine dehydratase [Chlamydiia bacterium]|nr:putative pterin-4-alpha-carbinolamine dehydratase [Chlamydiia bacterium]
MDDHLPLKKPMLLSKKELENLHLELGKSWKITSDNHLEKAFLFGNIKDLFSFTEEAAKQIEEEHHELDFSIKNHELVISLYTKSINGLAEDDFLLAAKMDAIYTGNTGEVSG